MRGAASPSIEIHAEFFPVETTKARCSVAYFTLSIDGTPDDAQRSVVEDVVRRLGGTMQWRVNAAAGRSYAMIQMRDTDDPAALRALPDAVLYDAAIIALAVSPSVPQALPSVVQAFEGPGRPAGILGCRSSAAGVILEWDPNVSDARLVLGLVDVELHRFASGRTTELLCPLPPEVVAKIAASGLGAPQVETGRVLELLIDDV
jgi:hypothetical protein